MTTRIGIVGDIHGEPVHLESVLAQIGGRVEHLVFVGDYVNRGTRSAEVLERLVRLQSERSCTFLAGNHDIAMLAALRDDLSFDRFLQLGGAATIRSYVPTPFGDVATQFVSSVPKAHLDFLAALQTDFETDDLVVAHDFAGVERLRTNRAVFGVCGHSIRASSQPTLLQDTALIDTGCGAVRDGRLTCLVWPDLTWLQSQL